MTHLSTREDLVWLAETHLPQIRPLIEQGHPPFVGALLFGNEDAPDSIDLFSEDRYDAPVLRFQRNDDGNYYCQGLRRSDN
jgi:hypothetical protein